jgi:hypothetical protein
VFTAAEVAPIVTPITRDRDETGDYIIVHDTPAPAGSLVERVGDLELVTKALRDQWFEEYETQTRRPLGLLPVAARHGYLLGYRAALRDAAEQVVLMRPHGGRAWTVEQAAAYDALTKAFDLLNAIAAELDGGSNNTSQED